MTGDGTGIRLAEFVARTHADGGRAPVIYSSGEGARPLPPPGHAPVSLRLPSRNAPTHTAVSTLLTSVRNSEEPIALIVDFAERLVPFLPPGAIPSSELSSVLESVQAAATDPVYSDHSHAVILIARNGELHRGLVEATGIRFVKVPGPTTEDRMAFLQLVMKRAEERPDQYATLEPGLTIEEIAAESGGVRNDDLARASKEAARDKQPLTLDRVRVRKRRVIERRAGEILRLHPPGRSLLDLAGHRHVHRFVRERQQSGQWPAVVLALGPPGSGKTYFVRCLAGTLGWNAVTFHNVRSPWVGETESNTHRALDLGHDMRPILYHFDEADGQIGRRTTGSSADGGTHERFIAEIWKYTSEPRPEEMFVLTSNRPDLIDRALLSRAEVVPLLHPTPGEVVELLPILASQLARFFSTEVDLYEVASLPKLRLTSGRALLAILQRAGTLADLESSERPAAIGQEHLVDAVCDYLPDPDPVEEEFMGLQAVWFTRSRTLLPWIADSDMNGSPQVPYYIEVLLDEKGELDRSRLRQRMNELDAELVRRRLGKEW